MWYNIPAQNVPERNVNGRVDVESQKGIVIGEEWTFIGTILIHLAHDKNN